MKTELSKIAQDLEKGTITEKEVRRLLLGLLGVRHMLIALLENVKKGNKCLYIYDDEAYVDEFLGNL
jgi:hypothetical protein